LLIRGRSITINFTRWILKMDKTNITLSVVMPVCNESDTIEEIITQIEAVNLKKEIIIVDDSSTDGTADILFSKFNKKDNIKLIFLKENHGKGFAIRTALEHVRGDIVIVQDADLEYDPRDYIKLIAPILENKTAVVYGSRFMDLDIPLYISTWIKSKFTGKDCSMGHLFFSHFLGILLLNLLVRILYNRKITDEATCYKVFKSDLISKIKLKSRRFEFCPEVTAKICKMGHKIYEVPISYNPRTTEHGKKLNWKDGVIAIFTLIKYRFID